MIHALSEAEIFVADRVMNKIIHIKFVLIEDGFDRSVKFDIILVIHSF